MVPPCSDRVSRAPPYSISSIRPFRIRGCHPLWPHFPECFARTRSTFGLVRVRSSLLTESRLISVPLGTEMFQFPRFASGPYGFRSGYPCGWVSPFRDLRINACCPLPGAFRRLPRLSSPVVAKAFTVCASSLDPLTPNPGVSRCPCVVFPFQSRVAWKNSHDRFTPLHQDPRVDCAILQSDWRFWRYFYRTVHIVKDL